MRHLCSGHSVRVACVVHETLVLIHSHLDAFSSASVMFLMALFQCQWAWRLCIGIGWQPYLALFLKFYCHLQNLHLSWSSGQLYCIQGLLRRVNIIYMFLNGGGKWRIWREPTNRGRICKRHSPDSTLSQLGFDGREFSLRDNRANHCATLLLYRHRLAVSALLLEVLSIQFSEETLHSSSTTCLAV